ncbi:MAG: AMP nucleosidase [Propylenella sp.]
MNRGTDLQSSASLAGPFARDLEAFDDPHKAVARIAEIYDRSLASIRAAFASGARGETIARVDACYPYVVVPVGRSDLHVDARLSYGVLLEPGTYGTTLTRPDLFDRYYREQISFVLGHHQVPVHVGVSNRPIPLPFVIEESVTDIAEEEVRALQSYFALPDLSATDDGIANGTFLGAPGEPRPLALFTAERVDYSLARLHHYMGTAPEHIQNFILLTNYQRYVDAFIAFGREHVGKDGYTEFVAPGNLIFPSAPRASGGPEPESPLYLPQMPAYHLKRADQDGITLINIGIGPSNAKTITDHLAVTRPHCWLMLGHCAGLRRSQLLGDYVLAHGYVRDDHVLDQDLPNWVPVPPIAEVQVALQEATAKVTGLRGHELKIRLRTGTVATTDNRNWELRFDELFNRLNLARAIAVDMESATVAANGLRFRVPYGTLLCVSDKPLHGELKLSGMANAFYRERVSQHLMVGIETMRLLREQGVDRLHSRKLRGFDEPAFR